jgi:choline dehydrogenase-like flavoprotein
MNSGNPIGMGIGAGCMFKGLRTTASAYLEDSPPNLTILINSLVAKVLISRSKAKAVRIIDGRGFYAKHDVILYGGALNSTTPDAVWDWSSSRT